MTLEVREGDTPKGSDAWFWGEISPDDSDDDLPLAWLDNPVPGVAQGNEQPKPSEDEGEG